MSESVLSYCPKCHPEFNANISAVNVKNIYVHYPGELNFQLENISFTIKIGTSVALLGPNGAGKSTLIKTLVGLIPISSGTIKLFEHALGDCHHQVAYVPQRSEIDWEFPISVHKLALSGSYIHLGWLKKPSEKFHQKTLQALELLGLLDVKNKLIGNLSVGQQQRALLARSLVHNAELFLLDEPFNAVDQETQKIMKQTFDTLRKEKKTVVIATHQRDHIEEEFDDAIFLSKGKMAKTLHFEH